MDMPYMNMTGFTLMLTQYGCFTASLLTDIADELLSKCCDQAATREQHIP